MRHPYIKTSALAMIVASAVMTTDAVAAVPAEYVTQFKKEQIAKPVRPFHGTLPWGLTADAPTTGKRRAAVDKPVVKFENLDNYDFLEGPDGTTWFYTTEYEIEREKVSEWYTEERIVAYTFTVYDETFHEVGTIKDRITLREGETKPAHAVLDPTVTFNFFNSDDKPEVMVYLAMNTSAVLGYTVNYYYKVYTLGADKDADGNDVCIATVEGRCADTFNAGTDGEENFFLTFVDDIEPNPSDFDNFLDYVNAYKTHVWVYTKAGDNEAPAVVFEKDIYLSRYPGDTTDGIYLITKEANGTPYFIFSEYEKPYFLDPTGFATDENATPDNNLVIEAYAFNGSMELVSTTHIPVVIEEIMDGVAYTFYSIGSISWRDDIDMSVNGTPTAPAYIVAVDKTTAANLEDIESNYVIYGNDGKAIRDLADDTDSIVVMYSASGDEPHALFINNADGIYTFHFTDLYSGKEYFSIEHTNGGDPLTASCARIKMPDGKYKYAFEMMYDETDEFGNDLKRIAWFNEDGSFDRIDSLNIGMESMYSAINMAPGCLSPTLYDDDEYMEYAVLVKRFVGNTTRNEFIVVDHTGEWYAYFTEDDGKGLPYTFTILPAKDANRLQMVYNDNYNFNVDLYTLPFSKIEQNFADLTIQGPWTFTLNGHYLGDYSLFEFEEEFDAVLDGNTVIFESTGSPYNIVAEFIAPDTLSLVSTLVGSPASTFGLWQYPYINTSGTEILEELTEEPFTARYDSATRTITFPEKSGLMYGYFNNETGALSYWDDAFDFVSAVYGAPQESSVEEIEAAGNGEVRFYNLQGAEVRNPAPGSILIKVAGGKATKVLVK